MRLTITVTVTKTLTVKRRTDEINWGLWPVNTN